MAYKQQQNTLEEKNQKMINHEWAGVGVWNKFSSALVVWAAKLNDRLEGYLKINKKKNNKKTKNKNQE